MPNSPIHLNINDDYFFKHNIDDTCTIDIHLHDSYEVFQACSDNINYYVEGNVYTLNTGDLIITNPHEIHKPATSNNQVYNRRFIQFNPTCLISLLDSKFDPLAIFNHRKPGEHNLIIPASAALIDINHIFTQIEQRIPRNNDKDALFIMSLINQLLVILDEIYPETNLPNQVKADPRITQVKQYIDNHYTSPVSLDQLCKDNYMDKYYLSHLFKEKTGFTILEYIQSKRIQKAKRLIHQGKSLTEISLLVGFSDYSNFYRTFKQLVKCSPSDYRKRAI